MFKELKTMYNWAVYTTRKAIYWGQHTRQALGQNYILHFGTSAISGGSEVEMLVGGRCPFCWMVKEGRTRVTCTTAPAPARQYTTSAASFVFCDSFEQNAST